MTSKIRAHASQLAAKKRNIQHWRVPKETKSEILRFVDDLALGKVNKGKRIYDSGQEKYLEMLKVPLNYLNKSTKQLKVNDIERFEKALNTNTIQSRLKGKPYAHATKVDIRKALKVFLRWRLGEAKMIKLVGWLDTRNQEKTPDYLTEIEIEKLLKACATAKQRFLIALLFDTGARAEEFLNIRYEDIHLPVGKENFVKIALKQEYSKTLGRTISLYWRHSLEVAQDYLRERIMDGIKADEPVFKDRYDAMRMYLHRLGLRVLNKHIHPHLFRHSSATYYATKLNRQELCYRYGWRFSSNMPDIYISRAGMENKELDVKFTSTEIGTLKDDFSKLQQQNKIKEERITTLQTEIEKMQKHLAMVTEVLAMKPTETEIQNALRKKSDVIHKRNPE